MNDFARGESLTELLESWASGADDGDTYDDADGGDGWISRGPDM